MSVFTKFTKRERERQPRRRAADIADASDLRRCSEKSPTPVDCRRLEFTFSQVSKIFQDRDRNLAACSEKIILRRQGIPWYDQHMQDLQEEPLNAFVQTQLSASAREQLRVVARRRHLTTSALLRILVMELLESQEARS